MNPELTPEERKLRQTIAWPLTSANNYPKHVAPHVLGADMTPIIDAVFAALKDAGYGMEKKPVPADPPLPLGTRVRVVSDFAYYKGREGVVVDSPYTLPARYPIRVQFESESNTVAEIFKLEELEVLD